MAVVQGGFWGSLLEDVHWVFHSFQMYLNTFCMICMHHVLSLYIES